ncbi:vWA domain-containing protein [Inconstantimicrobium mannanitabidum]|uniref:Uncharacterized protein n=1 Tax=Inconstantimicrobium mannanitabidum TaxID=1604901 RepID=A0ACB5R7B0_9CLOT|nr:VWA domain-containing protein [Clostridium sp. TW13]GKX64846.1 hypothetical protein rsdtw13_01040 [Clostridium sp. TW13]
MLKNKVGKKISIIMIALLTCVIAGVNLVKVKADVANKPGFDVSISLSKTQAMKGEDVIVNGRITPKDFEIDIPKKEIVLVLDVSGSMQDNSKLYNLKLAAKKFIDKMKNQVNLKIGIVAYSSLATINPDGYNGTINTKSIDQYYTHEVPNYNSIGTNLLDASDNRLYDMVDGLVAQGGTNIGEGLRKAAYMLKQGDSTANKSLILMTDGMATFRTVNVSGSSWSGYKITPYLNLDNQNHYYSGDGNNDDLGYNTDYAVSVGNLIKPQINSVFSIGYGLGDSNSSSNRKLSRIHGAMGGDDSNFFATDSGAVDVVFQKIADKILSSYEVSNIKMELNFNQNFNLNVEGNTVDIPNVTYKIKSIDGGKIIYSASPVDFSFIIQGNTIGDNFTVFDKAIVKFPWNNFELTASVPTNTISIVDNAVPNIQANLTSDKRVEVVQNSTSPINITYSINPSDCSDYNNLAGRKNDVIIVVDTSAAMSNYKSGVENALWGKLVNDNDLRAKNIRYALITYSNDVNRCEMLPQSVSDQDLFIKNIISSTPSSDANSRNIGSAISKIKTLFGNQNTDYKNIIFITAGPLDSYADNQLTDIKDKGFNVFSVCMGGDNDKTLQALHNKLSNNQNYYFYGNSDNNEINNNIMPKIKDSIKSENNNEYIIQNSKLIFNTNGEFTLGKFYSGSDVLQYKVTGNSYEISLGDRIKYTANNSTFKAAPVQISFKATLNNNTQVGERSFAESTLSYNNLIGINISKIIDTPTVVVKSAITITHGVYGGIDPNTKTPVIDTTDRTFNKSATVPMAASFEFYKGTTVKLDLDTNVQMVGTPIIYKVNADGTLTKIGTMDSNNSSQIGDGLVQGDKVLVLYNIKLPEAEGAYTNSMKVEDVAQPATIKVGKDGLPDLF